jgi:hypothetical protein
MQIKMAFGNRALEKMTFIMKLLFFNDAKPQKAFHSKISVFVFKQLVGNTKAKQNE